MILTRASPAGVVASTGHHRQPGRRPVQSTRRSTAVGGSAARTARPPPQPLSPQQGRPQRGVLNVSVSRIRENIHGKRSAMGEPEPGDAVGRASRQRSVEPAAGSLPPRIGSLRHHGLQALVIPGLDVTGLVGGRGHSRGRADWLTHGWNVTPCSVEFPTCPASSSTWTPSTSATMDVDEHVERASSTAGRREPQLPAVGDIVRLSPHASIVCAGSTESGKRCPARRSLARVTCC